MTVRVGVVGCGPIAGSYVSAARRYPNFEIVACAGRSADSASARIFAGRHGLRAMAYDEMLRGDIVDVVLVLTPAHAHVEPALAAIAAGMHVYCEKPLAATSADARSLVAAAAARGVSLGCAPDTVLGANVQHAATVIDSGEVGSVISGIAALGSRGMEHWHPDPTHLYASGGGPVMDKGPYYVAALVTLLGPIVSVRADGGRAFERRTISAHASPKCGTLIDVEVPTTVHAALRFRAGAIVTLILSWDVAGNSLPDIELYGAHGSIRLDDPNWFGGAVQVHTAGAWLRHDTGTQPLGVTTMQDVAGVPRADHRGIGLAEMADAIKHGRAPLCSGAFALHIMDVLTAIVAATESGVVVTVASPVEGFVAPRLSDMRIREILKVG